MEALLWAGRKILKWIGAANLLAFLLIANAMGCLVFGVQASVSGLDAWLMLAVALAGLIFGWLLSSTRIKGWSASLACLGAGLGLILLWAGRLVKPIAELAIEAERWYWQASRFGLLWFENPSALDYSNLEKAWTGLRLASGTLLERSGAWAWGMLSGRPSYDPLAMSLVWGLAAWLVAAWAAWWLWRRKQPLAALAPGGILLATSLAYTGSDIYSLVLWIGTAIGLQALGKYLQQSQEWQVRRLDRADIEAEWAIAVCFVAISMMSLALFTPSLSLDKIATGVQQAISPQQPVEGELAKALGLRQRKTATPTALERARNPGLPNQHLLGSGPELSQQVVMQVRIAGYAPEVEPGQAGQPARVLSGYYWRGVTYDRYTGKGWWTTQSSLEKYAAGQSIADRLAWQSAAPYQILHQEVSMSRDTGGLLYTAGELLEADEDYQVAWRSPGDFFAAQVASSSYAVDARLARPTPLQLRQAGEKYPDWVRQNYLTLPESVPRRVWALALDLTSTLPTPYDQALAIQSYLRQFPYTLEIQTPPAERDFVDYFLFDLQRGYCDYYASAMVVLARAAGLPARLVVGYASGNYQPEEELFIVTEAEAHAWAEIYFPGYGWIEFEPTAARPLLELPRDQQEQAAQVTLAVPQATVPSQVQLEKILPIALIGLAGMLVLLLAWGIGDRLRLVYSSPERAVALIYRRLYDTAKPLTFSLAPGTTPLEFASHLKQRILEIWPARSHSGTLQQNIDRLQRLVDVYSRLIYSQHLVSEGEKHRAIQDWSALRTNLYLVRLRKLFQPHRRSFG